MIFVCTKCTLLRCVYAGHYAPWMPPFTLGPLNIPLDLLGPHSSHVLPYKLLEYPSNVAVDPRGSWLPYSTYLYLDFHLLCSMTKLKEQSREICYFWPPFLKRALLGTFVPDAWLFTKVPQTIRETTETETSCWQLWQLIQTVAGFDIFYQQSTALTYFPAVDSFHIDEICIFYELS